MSDQPINERELQKTDRKAINRLLAGIAVLAIALILRDLILPYLSHR